MVIKIVVQPAVGAAALFQDITAGILGRGPVFNGGEHPPPASLLQFGMIECEACQHCQGNGRHEGRMLQL